MLLIKNSPKSELIKEDFKKIKIHSYIKHQVTEDHCLKYAHLMWK